MYLIDNRKETCSGCTACKIVCPRDAISMCEDEEGFKYPKIDKKRCINCKLCEKVCPNVKISSNNNIIKTYGVKIKDEYERQTSRSGGVFVALSDYVLENGGIIYGVKMDEKFNVFHDRATSKEERFEFKGSKYVQSDMNNVIRKTIDDLKDGKLVLFSGTSCQIAGLLSNVPENLKQNLFTCDLICHGVPSNRVFRDYLNYLELKENKKIKKFNFRDKKFGWNSHYETITFEDDSEISLDYFKKLFYNHIILRPSCHSCNYANTHRPADITIADFWGIDEVNPSFNDNKGVSLVIINSSKGLELFNKIKVKLHIIEVSINDCIKHTYTLNQPTPVSETRNEFWLDYDKMNFDEILLKYSN